MDIFKFRNPTAPTKMEQGEVVDGFKSKMWIERYREAGEFELIASIDTGIREKLPLGTFISHSDTDEIMIVENHEISDERGEVTDVKITGRGFESYLEQRIVGSNRNFPNNLGYSDYTLPEHYSWVQAVNLVKDHILTSQLVDDYDAIPFVQVLHTMTGTSDLAERSIKRGEDLYSALLGVLEIDQLGIRVVRPGPWSPLTPGSADTAFVIHKGVDRSAEIVYSYDTGEIESADYLWSLKRLKNSALVSGKWVEVRVDNLTDVEYKRRMMYVDASDIDEAFDAPPTGTDLNTITVKMEQRGFAALAAQRELALVKAEVSRENVRAVYRQDFNVGDLITVSGDYNETRAMRVSEYVEIEESGGQSSYPTLTVDE